MHIGPYQLANPVIAAPMAGVSDQPFRAVCREHGAGMVVSEMVTSQAQLRDSVKTRFRSDHRGEPEPRVIQIVGTEPDQMASAAQYNVAEGAQIIDINMGCPAKKVCKKAAGSALLGEPERVEQILRAVVSAVDVPVTVKIRTGVSPAERNGVEIAQIAENAGVAAITVHGRTRQCRFVGAVEYDTIAQIKSAVSIPVVANGDIETPEQARNVLLQTGADAVMLGRAAQGQPWLFEQVAHFLANGTLLATPALARRRAIMLAHIEAIHTFYGPRLGIKFARKHIKWYLNRWDYVLDKEALRDITTTEHCEQQLERLRALTSLDNCCLDAAA